MRKFTFFLVLFYALVSQVCVAANVSGSYRSLILNGEIDLSRDFSLGINAHEASINQEVTDDLTAPTLILETVATSPVSESFMATITFSEEVEGFEAADITVENGSVSGGLTSTDNIIFTATVVPTSDGEVTMSIAAGVTQDLAGNANDVSECLVVTADLTAPTVVLETVATSPVSGIFMVTVTFSEEVEGFEAADITVENGSVSGELTSIDDVIFTATVVATSDGEVTMSIATGVAQDLAGNANEVSESLVVIVDLTPPTVVLETVATSPVSGNFMVTVTFSEEVEGFEAADITVENGSVSGELTSTDDIIFTATVVPASDGEVTVSIATGVTQDLVGNTNGASESLVVTADLTAPTVVLETDATYVYGEFDVTITFSEEVVGFDAADITVENGSVSGDLTSTDDIVFTAAVIPTSGGEVTVSVPTGAAQDAAGNANLASESLQVIFPTTISIRPDADSGVDAEIESILPNENAGDDETLNAFAWTQGGVLNVIRGLIDFDLSDITESSLILEAKISLYFDANYISISGHYGENDLQIKRITSSWTEDGVTWDTQPTTSDENIVDVEASTTSDQDYTDIDITGLVQSYVDNPTSSFGFMINLLNETPYAIVLLASSDHPDSDVHPEISITYCESNVKSANQSQENIYIENSIKEEDDVLKGDDDDLMVYPNPATDIVNIDINSEHAVHVDIYSLSGRLVMTNVLNQAKETIDVGQLENGVYLLHIKTATRIVTRKLVVKRY